MRQPSPSRLTRAGAAWLPHIPTSLWRSLVPLALILLLSAATTGAAQVKRVVVVKMDGLAHGQVERFIHEIDPRTGRSLLPWIEHIFYQRGTRLENFYVRGMSLSAPSWSILDTGRHLQIKGNVEYDRWTLRTYDYLNFIPFYLNYAAQRRVDMPGPEVLDELGIPLLMDAFPYEQRQTSFQLYQRGARWTTLQRGLQNRVTSRSPAELFDEWVMGLEVRAIIQEQLERELTAKLRDPAIRYLDYYDTEFDHAAHHNRDRDTHLRALQEIDATIGRIWTAIQKSPLAAETALVLVSDHGTNSVEGIYSQGYNLVRLLGSPEGGGHHVITKRRLLTDYSLKGIYPLVPLITTTTPDSTYLQGESTDYPTALLDFDGNERVAIHLRESDLNQLHILLLQLQRPDLAPELRRAAREAFFSIIERRGPAWAREIEQLNEELAATRREIERLRTVVAAQPKKWTKAETDTGRDKIALRNFARMDTLQTQEREYAEYARILGNLLGLRREAFDPAALKIAEVIPRRSMGDPNTIYQLQNYVTGPAARGLTLQADKTLDFARSFARVDYFKLLYQITVRNNVQKGVGNRPVDFIAVRIPRELLRDALAEDELPTTEAVWLYGGEERQALILAREGADEQLWLRYLPVSALRQDEQGRVSLQRLAWQNGLPLKIWEDEQLGLDAHRKADWLQGWHRDAEWLEVLHRTQYSNAVVGLHEHFARHETAAIDPETPGLSQDERWRRRLRRRQRRLVEPDLLVLASDHWNFDVRGFNPGGNHGSFFRISTHSTLMFAGAKIPVAQVVKKPYDGLSFVPTLLTLLGQLQDGQPVPELWERGFRPFPGPVIEELFEKRDEGQPVTTAGGERREAP